MGGLRFRRRQRRTGLSSRTRPDSPHRADNYRAYGTDRARLLRLEDGHRLRWSNEHSGVSRADQSQVDGGLHPQRKSGKHACMSAVWRSRGLRVAGSAHRLARKRLQRTPNALNCRSRSEGCPGRGRRSVGFAARTPADQGDEGHYQQSCWHCNHDGQPERHVENTDDQREDHWAHSAPDPGSYRRLSRVRRFRTVQVSQLLASRPPQRSSQGTGHSIFIRGTLRKRAFGSLRRQPGASSSAAAGAGFSGRW